jgi:HEPN domain-containing protein
MERSADWMDEARKDLEHAQHDLEHEYYNWACFSAQQAAEKAVKAVFQKMGAEAWGHVVTALLEELSDQHPVTKEIREAAQELDKAYVPTRYPNAHLAGSPHSLYNETEARRMIGHAEKILQFCQSLLAAL